MNELINKQLLYFGIGAALFLELVSFVAFFLPEYSIMLGFFLAVLFVAITVRDLRLGIYLVFIELAIGGHGYFSSLPVLDNVVAMRHIWFLSLLIIFFATKWRFVVEVVKKHTLIHRLIFLGVVGLLASLVAIVLGYPLNNIFSDANAYLFYLLIVPMLFIVPNMSKEGLLNILFGALVVLSFKTLLTLAIFSNSFIFSSQWYLWVRDLRFGEVTHIDLSFFRVFFQSQVMLLPALALIASYILHAKERIQQEEKIILIGLLSLFVASFILSLSRSFWLGAFVGSIVFMVLLSTRRRSLFKNLRGVIGYYLTASLIAIFLLTAAQSFSFDTSLLFYKLGDLQEEPAAASRWALLPVMIDGIKENPVFGNGFGREITYITSDPRIREATDGTGEYTTFALEWGYLDIWLKMGLVGLGAIIYLIWYFLALQLKNMRQNSDNWYAFGMTISLIMLFSLHFFTPYLNHPIGVGYLVLGLL